MNRVNNGFMRKGWLPCGWVGMQSEQLSSAGWLRACL